MANGDLLYSGIVGTVEVEEDPVDRDSGRAVKGPEDRFSRLSPDVELCEPIDVTG